MSLRLRPGFFCAQRRTSPRSQCAERTRAKGLPLAGNARKLEIPVPGDPPATRRARCGTVAVRASGGSAAPLPPAAKKTPAGQMLVFVPPHPLVKHWVSLLRNESTPSPVFRSAMAELGRVLIYEAARDWLPTLTGQIQTPCGVADVEFLDLRDSIKVVPILRAGLCLIDNMSTVIPLTSTYHIGYRRDESTLLPSLYLNKLPSRFSPDARVLIADPMLATGGTMMAALDEVLDRGAAMENIRVVCAIASGPGLSQMSTKYRGLKIYTGIIDADLNDKGFIVPGLGDAGDRCFGTE